MLPFTEDGIQQRSFQIVRTKPVGADEAFPACASKGERLSAPFDLAAVFGKQKNERIPVGRLLRKRSIYRAAYLF